MEVILFKDSIIECDLHHITEGLNSIVPDISFRIGEVPFDVPFSPMREPEIYELLSPDIWNEVESPNIGICFTREPYENNYFFESFTNLAVISFYYWEHLTNLSINTGIVFFIAAVLGRLLDLGELHDRTTGCINDAWWDKRGVDVAMRSAFICPECKKYFTDSSPLDYHQRIYDSLLPVLDNLSNASRNNTDIIEFWRFNSEEKEFDVFLCHNSEDKKQVRKIFIKLKEKGIKPWLDEEQLRPGFSWQIALEEQISEIKSVGVFVGRSGLGPWQNMELRAFLEEFTRRQCPVIPVILPDARTVPELPIFLRQLTWVDFRKDYSKALRYLIWGITGFKTN